MCVDAVQLYIALPPENENGTNQSSGAATGYRAGGLYRLATGEKKGKWAAAAMLHNIVETRPAKEVDPVACG